jgi:purine nucleosidase
MPDTRITTLTRRKFLIDTDGAADDIIALILALRREDLCIEAITVVSGACAARQGVQNVLYLLELLGSPIRVYEGRQTPLLGHLRDSTHIMGTDGLGDIGLPLAGRVCESLPAPDVIRQTIRKHAGDLTIVCLGPLTNLAIALLTEPDLATDIGRLVIMGGVTDGVGNITPAAEFNIWADPEAARVVFESGAKIDMVGWCVSRAESASFSFEELEDMRSLGTPLATLAIDILSGLRRFLRDVIGTNRIDLPDPFAMAIAIDQDVAKTWLKRYVEIDTGTGPSRGATIIDHLGVTGRDANARVAQHADKLALITMLRRALVI